MKYSLLLFALLTFLLTGCKKKHLRYQKVCKSGAIEILLLDVHDSRCPSDTDCIWEGNASVSLRMIKGSEMVDFSLNTHSDFTQDTTVLQRHVELLSVKPYPKSDKTYSLEDYRVKLKVTKV